MKQPPDTIDGAKVLFWALSHPEPIFIMRSADGKVAINIHGLAVCQYPNGQTHRFSCDEKWETQNDIDCDTPEQALTAPSYQYDVSKVNWNKK